MIHLMRAASAMTLAALLSGEAAAGSSPDMAYRPVPGFSAQAKPARLPIAPDDLAQLVDKEMQRQMAEAYIAGAAVTIVHQGRILLSKGYGFADIESQHAVTPASTLFRLGSTTKPFTALAVMQLVEDGELDLDADINGYLQGMQIPGLAGQVITARNLLTHTAGFDVDNFGYQVSLQAPPPSMGLREALAAHEPPRVRPPLTDFARGVDAAYSNWGVALAGLIAAQLRNTGYPSTIERHVLQPLQMSHSSMEEPLPSALKPRMSVGYSGGGPFQPHPFMYFNAVAPAASLSATADDMGRFMLGQLDRSTGNPVLNPDTLAAMHARVLSPSPHVNGAALGWMEDYQYGRRILWHSGLTLYFYNELYLLPEEGFGLFVAYNTQPTPDLKGALMRLFMKTYFPYTLPPLSAPASGGTVARYAGSYAPTPRSLRSWEKLFTLLYAYQIETDGPGRMRMTDQATGTPSIWVESDQVPGLFRREDSGETMQFVSNGGTDYQLGSLAFAPSTRLPPWETPRVNFVLLGTWALAFLLSVLDCLRRLLSRRTVPGWQKLAAPAALGYLGLMGCVAATVTSPTAELLVALPFKLKLGLSLGVLATGLSLILAWHLIRNPRSGAGWVSLGLCLSFSFWLNYWRLLGFHFA